MKELSIEQKAERFDEAIERAKGVIEQNPLMEYLKKGIEYIFPELKESKDERIRQLLIGVVELYYGNTDEQEKKDCLAWLEKQGNYNGLVEKAKAYNEAHMQDVRERATIAALSGTLSDPNTVGNFEQFADAAVGYADALIERLKKK